METKCKYISRKNFKETKEKCLDVTEGWLKTLSPSVQMNNEFEHQIISFFAQGTA